MVSDLDQFGRDTTKNNNPSFNEEKSKKILDSLAEIKNQLENKDYNPNVDDSSPRIRASNLKNKSDFDELKLKIESLEKRNVYGLLIWIFLKLNFFLEILSIS